MIRYAIMFRHVSYSSSRTLPNKWSSACVSQSRNLGQARVQLVHPFSPWTQLEIPSSSSRWKGLYWPGSCLYPITSWGQEITQPAQPVQSPDVITSSCNSFHWKDQRAFFALGDVSTFAMMRGYILSKSECCRKENFDFLVIYRNFAPSAGFEPAHMAPEANALSPELRGRIFSG